MSGLAAIFHEYKNTPAALYGLGTETEKALAELGDEFHIVGLLDGFRQEGFLYGKQIISLAQCVRRKVKLIIVVARPGSCRAIAGRIGKFCLENQIALSDIRGKNLCLQNRKVYDFAGVEGVTREQVMELAADKDVVSFDLFDTLVMRRVLFDTDVIALTESGLREKGIMIEGFCEKRQQAEKELSKDAAPTLEEIYQSVLNSSMPAEITARELAEAEWMTDYGLLVPREEMAEVLSLVCGSGKKVYIVSDTYYSRAQLEKILEKCCIRGYEDIFASSEYGTGKRQNLFWELKAVAGGQKCLHIGDDPEADIEPASRMGFDACRIYSGLDLLELTGYLGMWEHMDTLSSRVKIGLFTARLFNSPFMFEAGDRKLSLREAYDVGYLIMAPMITDFTVWFSCKVKEKNLTNIWFGARDGYLIKKLYDFLNGNRNSVYFLTSRMAAIRAGMDGEEDIAYVAAMKFSGTLQQQLKERFGVAVERGDTENRTLMDFSQLIIEKAQENKKNYRVYLQNLPMNEGNTAFFDFVAKGTSQMYIGRLAEKHLSGLYFLRLEKEAMCGKDLDITAFYENEESPECAVYDNYYILETVLTSGDPSVVGFDSGGKAVYAHETRKKQDILCVEKMQEGIMDYFRSYIGICPKTEMNEDKRLDEIFLDLIHKLKILDKDVMNLTVEDPFFNRITDIADLI